MPVTTGPTEERLRKANRVAELRAAGKTLHQVAVSMGISHGYVRSLIDDPDGAKQRARRDSYAGRCEDCGAATKSDGTSRAAARCPACAAAISRIWTAETVIAAILKFAREHGRPPTATEWKKTDPDRGYPAATSCYQTRGGSPGAPFASWADAIAAAGFPRPHSGRRTRHEGGAVMQQRAGYVVLREVEDGVWKVVGESEERTAVSALNAVMNGQAPEGKWVAIPGGYWRPRTLAPRTIYDWSED